MKKIVILIIMPDIKSDKSKPNKKFTDEEWNNAVNFWSSNQTNNCVIYPTEDGCDKSQISMLQRWALGYIYWQKIISQSKYKNIDFYFIRSDYQLNKDNEIINNHMTVYYDESFGHIIYKTFKSLEILQNKYDFFIRTNVNTVIDLDNLNKFIENINDTNIFTSPFWEGGSYPYGYFILISNDIANHIISHGLIEKWKYNDLPDDYELTQVILKKFNYYILDDCDKPHTQSDKVNKYGIRFNADDMGESSDVIIDAINNAPDSIFLYRIKNISDNEYIKVYDYVMKKIDK